MDYDKTAMPANYDSGRSYSPDVLAYWLNVVSRHANGAAIADILDLGCGTGRYSEGLATHFDARVIAEVAVGLQHGPAGDRLHLHGLIGGVGRHQLRQSYLRGNWRRGSIDLDGYHPRLGGVEYMVRQAKEIELLGSPRPYRPRRR